MQTPPKTESTLITIGIYDQHKIMRQALSVLLASNSEFRAIPLEPDPMHIADKIKVESINIMLFNLHTASDELFNLIKQLTQRFERMKVMVMASCNDDKLIVRAIRSGAKGFMASDAEPNELTEAIYTIRGGYEYYSKSISHLLVGRYINEMIADKASTSGIEQLSARQIEIIRLWGANKSNKEIADELFLSIRTVESHKNHIMQKLNLKTTVDMIKFGIRNNLIEL